MKDVGGESFGWYILLLVLLDHLDNVNVLYEEGKIPTYIKRYCPNGYNIIYPLY